MSNADHDPDALPEFEAPSDGRLDAAMRDAFDAAGVLILSDYYPHSTCESLRRHALELVEAFDPASVRSVFSTTSQAQLDDDYFIGSGDKVRFFLEAEAFDGDGRLRQSKHDSLNKMGHAMHDVDPVFERFSYTPKLAATVRSLGFEKPGIIQSMYIFKPPRIGGEVVCHQDSTYLYTDPESCIGFWFALEDATLENGCMQFIPGAHKGPLKARNYRASDGRLVTEVLDETPWPPEQLRPAEAKAGTLVIFHGRAPHMSEPNRSDRSRHAYTLHVIDRLSSYPAENWLQRGRDLPLRGMES